MERIINTKQLRAALPKMVERVRRGERFTVLYRSRPACRIVPVADGRLEPAQSVEDDPLYRAEPVGRSTDGRTSRDHDRILYDIDDS
ncbi:MAG: hypothetical protein IT293_11255 [Deltaproteobacteria bacterium]|nr:hypothetical protein [Deltaproteobacteria bacterium]